VPRLPLLCYPALAGRRGMKCGWFDRFEASLLVGPRQRCYAVRRMPHRYAAFGWSIAIASGWTAEIHEETTLGETTAYLEIVPETRDALLRLTPDERGLQGAAEWVEAVGWINLAKGRRVSPAQCGDFIGINVEFGSGDEWLRGWALRAEAMPLDAHYQCSADHAGRDDQVVEEMLNSLRIEKSRG
jgi:hypothetical protein